MSGNYHVSLERDSAFEVHHEDSDFSVIVIDNWHRAGACLFLFALVLIIGQTTAQGLELKALLHRQRAQKQGH